MSGLDWLVLSFSLGFIVLYGAWVTSKKKGLDTLLIGNREAKWWTVGLSVMATQASAITFLSTPGQAYHDGMGFVQFYFGLPIAMVIICLFFIPIYSKLKVYTAYEYLESRFDYKTRALTSVLFLVQRGLAAGITIYAPAIVLSTVLGWNLRFLIVIIGLLVIFYTMIGGSKAVNVTQKYQMGIIFLGMFVAFYLILHNLPANLGFTESLQIAGAAGKMEVLDFSWDLNNRYTFWSGIIGGSFLALSYFGTDQSQVQRYLTGKNARESQLGMIFNGMVKVPMQFFILLTGVMVFVFYQFNAAPSFFNTKTIEKVQTTEYAQEYQKLDDELKEIFTAKSTLISNPTEFQNNEKAKYQYSAFISQEKEIREEIKQVIKKAVPTAVINDKDYVFIHFILNNLPKGLIGLLLAVFFSAAMSSTASELNALSSTTLVDIYKRGINQTASESHYVLMTRLFTGMWGVIAILFACFGQLFENLIQFVNIIGSLFYGTILGIFLVAFFIKHIGSRAIFIAAIISEILIIAIWYYDLLGISYLWLNFIGSALVIILALMLQMLLPKSSLKAV